MEIYLIRHTAPQVPEGVCYGRSDLPLRESFADEWARLKVKLPESFDCVYTSPLRRCRQLAELLLTNGNGLKVDGRLLEVDFGEWEMKRWDEIDPETLQKWTDNFVEKGPPGGESFRGVARRVESFWKDLAGLSFSGVAVVSHAGFIRTAVAQVIGLPLRESFNLHFDFGGVSLIETAHPRLGRGRERGKLRYLNL